LKILLSKALTLWVLFMGTEESSDREVLEVVHLLVAGVEDVLD
jgi:hypothetical protein